MSACLETGGVAALHAEAIGAVEGLHVAGAFSRNPGNVRHFTDRYGGRGHAAREELLRDDAVAVVAVCTPPEVHVPQAIEALRAGKHVIVEKPVAGTLAELEVLQREAERAGRLCVPCHNYVYAPELRRARELVRGGRLGRIASFWLLYNQAHDPGMGVPGVTLRRLCVHHAYALLFFLGRPESVSRPPATFTSTIPPRTIR